MDAGGVALWVIIMLVLLALAFDFMNGFHDAANSIATVVSTGVLKPGQAVLFAAFFNFVAIFVFQLSVATTVGKGIVDAGVVDTHVIFGALIGATQDGQVQLREIIRDRLKYVRRDPNGVPEKIVLFPGASANQRSASIVIDPRLSFGRPVIDGFGIRSAIINERFMANESMEDIARDYAVPVEAIQNAIRCERLAA